jgi:hypothetical protein
MLRAPSVLSSVCFASLVAGAVACGTGAANPDDLRPDTHDAYDVADVTDTADADLPNPDIDAPIEPREHPTCCTAALCAQLQGTCDAETCRCVPAAACCTTELCAAAGMACDAGTCRCARVTCQVEGAHCDESLVPGEDGRLVCTATSAGLVCLRRVEGWTGCAGGVCGNWGSGSCTCGWFGCTPWEDFCGPDQDCVTGPYQPLTSGTCGVAGNVGEGEVCFSSDVCASGLACQSVCVRVECGLAPGAPSCPAGRVCRPLDAWGLLGTCRVPCDPYDPAGPCGPGQWCRGPCAYLESALFCSEADAPTYGLLGGWCTPYRDGSIPQEGAACDSAPCAPGFLCAGGVCLEACPAGLPPDAAVRDQAACAPGLECAPVQANWPIVTAGGACATPCDPFAVDPNAACPPDRVCTMSAFATPSLAHCLPQTWPLAGPGEYCSPQGYACQAGHACVSLGPRRAYRCEPACRVGAAAGDPDACPAGQRCFRFYDPMANAWAPWGSCATPCEPFATDDASGCLPTAACEPRDRDPATGRLVGLCYDRDSGTEGQPCLSAEPGTQQGCAPGLTCRPEGAGFRCRVRCDAEGAQTGQGRCPDQQTCRRAWPPAGEPVMAGCVPK